MFNYWILCNFQIFCLLTLFLRRLNLIWGAKWRSRGLGYFANIQKWFVLFKLYFRALILLLDWFLKWMFFRFACHTLRGNFLPVGIWLNVLKELIYFLFHWRVYTFMRSYLHFIRIWSILLKLRSLANQRFFHCCFFKIREVYFRSRLSVYYWVDFKLCKFILFWYFGQPRCWFLRILAQMRYFKNCFSKFYRV